MAHIFKYAVLMAVPDPARGERVNVGLVIFRADRVDVRFAELSKVRALTGNDWGEYALDVGRRLSSYASPEEAQEAFASQERFDPVFRASELSWFSVGTAAQYEARVQELLEAMVKRPKSPTPAARSSRFNTQIASLLKHEKALAGREEPLSSHKVVRDLPIEGQLTADFAQQNGVMRVMSALDLRRPSVDLKEASLKAITLDQATEVFGKNTQRIGVYALPVPDDAQFKLHVKLLGDYSDRLFNWENPVERKSFVRYVHDGMGATGPLI